MPDVVSESVVPAISFSGVSKAFGDITVLNALDLSVARGERVTLIGPSGSGKTTVLRLAMTLERPNAGDICIFGQSIVQDASGRILEPSEEARIRRRCGMVFQQFNLFPHLTVLDNLLLAPRSVLGMSKTQATELAMEYLGLVGLEAKAHAWPASLSGGQQQRIAIARALVLKPEILLLDEITSALDPELVAEVLDVVREIARKGQTTMLIVTHEMGFAREVSDRVVVFDAGHVIEQGSAEQIFREPTSERTRLFLRSVLER